MFIALLFGHHQPGDVVSLRSRPTAADPRVEWLAVVRTVAYLRSGEPAIFVTWLTPIDRDTYFEGDEDDEFLQLQPQQYVEEAHTGMMGLLRRLRGDTVLICSAFLQDHSDDDQPPPPPREPTPPPPPPPPPLPQPVETASESPEPEGETEVILPNGKKGIRCTCGRVFSSGQALGGHRGKCKVPRERQRDRDARARAEAMGIPYVPPQPPQPSPSVSRPQRERETPLPAKRGNRGAAPGPASAVARQPALAVKLPRMQFVRVDDYALGAHEVLPQPLAAIVKIHRSRHYILPQAALLFDKQLAAQRYSPEVRRDGEEEGAMMMMVTWRLDAKLNLTSILSTYCSVLGREREQHDAAWASGGSALWQWSCISARVVAAA